MQRSWILVLACVFLLLSGLVGGAWWLLGVGGPTDSASASPASSPLDPRPESRDSGTIGFGSQDFGPPPSNPPPNSGERRSQIARAPFRGRVVDHHTGRPLRDAYVRLRQGARVETRMAEEDGRFVTAKDFDLGPIEIMVTQPASGFRRPLRLEGPKGRHPTVTLEHLRAHGPDEERTISVATGPSLALAIDPPEALLGWPLEGRLVDRLPGGATWPWVPIEVEPASVDSAGSSAPPLGRLHYFRNHVPEALGTHGYVEVRAPGDWSGEAPWTFREGPAPEPLPIPLTRYGRLEGRVLEGIETPYGGAGLSLVYEGEGEGWQHTESDPWGKFDFAGLELGSYRLVVRAPERPPITQSILIAAGDNHVGDLRLREVERAGSISGAVHVRGFPGELWMSVRLTSRNGGSVERTQRSGPVSFAQLEGEDARWDFEFLDVPVGSYSVEVFTVPELACGARIQRVLAPAQDIEFLCTASGGFDSIAFRPKTPEGEPIEDAMVMLQMEESWVPSPLLIEYGEPVWQTPRGSPTRWILGAEGYRPVGGGLADFSRDEDGTLVAEVVLEPGWSAILLARDAAPLLDSYYEGFLEDGMASFRAPPIAGATVYADGHPVGTTDHEGLVTILLEAEPSELTIRKPGWTYFGSDELEDGVLTGDRTPAVMWLRR